MKHDNCTHIFVCTNKKSHGKCCSMFNSESIYEYFKKEINRKRPLIKGRQRIKVVKTSCLGQCAAGPNILITPDNTWYTFSCLEDIDEIIDSHLIEEKEVTRLVNTGICI